MIARRFALVLGLVLLLLGIAGFVPPLAPEETGGNLAAVAGAARLGTGDPMLVGLFPVNAALSTLHILCSLAGLAASRRSGAALGFARGLAVLFAVLALAGLLPATQTGFGLMPLYAKDVWLHGALALAAAYSGWGGQESERRGTPLN